MRKLLLVVLAVFVFSPLNAGIKIAYNDFTITNADAKLRFYTDSVFGARGDGLRMGGTVSTLDFNQSFTSYNPSSLAFQKSPVVSFSGIPFEFVSTGFAGFVVNRDFGTDFASSISNIAGTFTSPAGVSIKASTFYGAQANGITGMEGMLPFADNNAAIGVAREEKFGFELGLLGEGMSASIDLSDPANIGFGMNISATAEFAADISIKSMVTSIGIGRKITPQWGVGAVLEYIDTKLSIGANAGAQATAMNLADGTTFEYNTNTLNSLAQYLNGELKAAAWSLRVGTSFHAPNDLAEIAVDFSIQPTFTFGGQLNGMAHTLPTDSNVIISDYLAGRTTTVEDPWTSEGMDIKLKLPSYFRLTLAYKPGPVIAFNYTRYFNNLSLSINDSEMTGQVYLATTDIFRIGLNFEYFQIGGGMAIGRQGSIMDFKNDSEPVSVSNTTMPYPIASFGFVIPMGSYMKTEVEIAAFPLPVMKTSLTMSY